MFIEYYDKFRTDISDEPIETDQSISAPYNISSNTNDYKYQDYDTDDNSDNNIEYDEY